MLAEKERCQKEIDPGILISTFEPGGNPLLMDFARALGSSLIGKKPRLGIAIVAGAWVKGGQVNSGVWDTRRGAETGFNWPQLTMRLIGMSRMASSSQHFISSITYLMRFGNSKPTSLSAQCYARPRRVQTNPIQTKHDFCKSQTTRRYKYHSLTRYILQQAHPPSIYIFLLSPQS